MKKLLCGLFGAGLCAGIIALIYHPARRDYVAV